MSNCRFNVINSAITATKFIPSTCFRVDLYFFKALALRVLHMFGDLVTQYSLSVLHQSPSQLRLG